MKYIKKTLSNGMCIILAPSKNTKIVTMGFYIKVGSRNEELENNGIAHFLEHMMFKGTTNRNTDQLFQELDSLGAVYNAATTTQYTYYYVYGNSNDIKQLLDIIFDIYINAKFDDSEIKKEKNVIIEEMRNYNDTPFSKLHNNLYKKLYENTSLSKKVMGNKNVVKNLSKKDLNDFRSIYYIPENTIFIVTGNFNSHVVFKIVKNTLSKIKNVSKPIKTYFEEKAIIINKMHKQSEPYINIMRNNNMKQSYVILAYPLYDLYDSKKHKIILLTQLLSAGFSSRLNKALRENEGISYVSEAYPIVYEDNGLFIIQTIINPVNLKKGINIILNELKNVKMHPITNNELKKIINISKNEIIYSFMNPTKIMSYLGTNFIFDREYQADINQDIKKFEKTTQRDIQKIACQIFRDDKINLFIYGNVEKNFKLDL